MHEVRFSSYRYGDHALHLEGSYFKGRVQLLQKEGVKVWRLFVWHRLEDAQKGSWVLEGLEPLAFQVYDDLTCQAEGVPDLKLWLDPFGFAWEGLEAPELEAHRFGQLGKAAVGESSEWTAFHEVNDGLPLGAGLSLLIKEKAERHYYGLGERTGFLDKKGRTWTNWATDNPTHYPDADPLYQAHPFLMGLEEGKAWGLYLDETWRTVFDLASAEDHQSLIRTDGPTLDLYLIAGPSPKEVIRRYTALVGRANLPPLWALGYHQCRYSYTHQELALQIAREYRRRDIPLDALWLDIDYMDGFKVFTFSPERFPEPQKLTAALREMGVRTVTIVDPGIKKEAGYPVYEEGHAREYFIHSYRDEELWGEVWPNPAVWPDFTRAEVREWWGGLHRFYLERGVAGIWNDMNEPAAFTVFGQEPPKDNRTLPNSARQGNHYHAEVHNLYGYGMCQATYEGLRRLEPAKRPFILTRSGFAGIQKYAFVWTGDNHSYWEHLEGSIPMLLNLGLSGVPFVGADIGGFSAHADGELLARWTWLGVFYPFMRNHSGKTSRRQEPWVFGPRWEESIREAIRLRYRMLPYLYTLAQEAVATGLPPMRAMLLEHPHDPETLALHDQFMWGSDLLVAPATRPGQRHRLVYLPQGEWQDFWSGEVYEGPLHLPTATPHDRIPLFQRSGSAIPTTKVEPHTTDAHWETLVWQVALAPEVRGRVYEDQGEGYGPGYVSELEGTYDGYTLRLAFTDRAGQPRQRVEAVVRGVRQPQIGPSVHHYDPETQTLILDLTSGSAEAHW